MLNFPEILVERFVRELKEAYQQTYSDMQAQYANVIEWTGRLALENIANSDALYHNVEHTILVTLVGQAILKGKHLSAGGVLPRDWLHVTMALLCHDIGYVRGCAGQIAVEFTQPAAATRWLNYLQMGQMLP
jgi:hypothetical protein